MCGGVKEQVLVRNQGGKNCGMDVDSLVLWSLEVIPHKALHDVLCPGKDTTISFQHFHQESLIEEKLLW